jgi:hypothetical protein
MSKRASGRKRRATESAFEKLLAKRLPGNGRFRVGPVSFDATVKLFPLSFGNRQNLGGVGEAIPEVLGELDALRHSQSAEIHDRLTHPFKIESKNAWGKVANSALPDGPYTSEAGWSMTRWDRLGAGARSPPAFPTPHLRGYLGSLPRALRPVRVRKPGSPGPSSEPGFDPPTRSPPPSMPIRVLGSVTERDNRLLVCRRPLHKRHGGLWEFPGGKVRERESDVLLVGQGGLRRVERRAGSTARKAARWRWGAQRPAAAALFCVTFFAAFVASARLTLPVLAESWTVRREVGAFDVAFTPNVPFLSSPSSVNRQHTGAGQRGQGIQSSPTSYSTPESSPEVCEAPHPGALGPPSEAWSHAGFGR